LGRPHGPGTVLGRGVIRIVNLPVLLLITFRPEFEPPWIGQPNVTVLTLNRLMRREVDAMIDRVAGNKPMPANIRQEIIERTDGRRRRGSKRWRAVTPRIAAASPAPRDICHA
jgi:hypothetical protein